VKKSENSSKDFFHPKLVASCFGFQAVAHALGGEVGKNPSEKEVLQTEEIHLTSGFYNVGCELFPSNRVVLLESHGDCVIRLPKNAELVGTSLSASHEIFLVGNSVLAMQSHPEWSTSEIVNKILPEREQLSETQKAQIEQSIKSTFSSTDQSRMIEVIKNFLKK